ncbi:hypothetical protein C7H19_00745 [Aphanothece hegewaldii CCALA 016]|uniref:Type II secretion system protein GspE N-terminal domain-containing protein n=1 Tax=Aphanothece hegewaldii CCALA 016 TaxID=2107694 RepID=A0A2T1M3D6_9CHRO|nr:hypothetical protein [Aphanothece hegewaldii]PSF39349.1 hypothetical protein C7H19_00745 [Aphanothece hegewaldii CCALA 016]
MSLNNDFSQATFPPFLNQLLQSGYLTLPQVQQALIEKRQSERSLTEIIETITGHLLPSDIFKQYRREQLFILKILHGVDVIDPDTLPNIWSDIEPLLKSFIPLEFCHRHQVLPIARRDGEFMVITLAMVNPDRHEILEDLRQILKINDVKFERKVIRQQDYNRLLKQYLPHLSPLRQFKEQELETVVEMTEDFAVIPSVLEEQIQVVEKTRPILEQGKQNLNQVIEETLSPVKEIPSLTNEQKITDRLRNFEKLLSLTCQEFELLKQEFSTFLTPASEAITEELQDVQSWKTLVKDFVSGAETIISEPYEELTDPGDWEKLRDQLHPAQETIIFDICEDEPVNHPVKSSLISSVPDPWS